MRVYKNISERFRQMIEQIRKSMPAGSTDVGPVSICSTASAISAAVMLRCVRLRDRSAVLRRIGESIRMSKNLTIVHNPLFLADFPDPSVVVTEDAVYMTTTSMHFMPGIPIMRSYDLAHWEIISYVYDHFENNAAHCLEDGQSIYSQGSWATSFRFHKGIFYVCFNSNDMQNTYIYRTADLTGSKWHRTVIPGFHHDPSLLFEDGRVFIVYGNGTIHIKELESDCTTVKVDGIDQVLLDTPVVEGLNCEGSHIHKVGDYYYLMMIQWPKSGSGRRIQWCYRSEELLGEYTGKIILDDDMGYQNNGVAQGGIFKFKNEWYAMLFQDRDSVGRCPVLMPVSWQDDWPVLGIEGKVPHEFEVPLQEKKAEPFTISDDFEYETDNLLFAWQFNHNPDDRYWSVTERPGYLRLKNGHLSNCLENARNTLTQRTTGPVSSFYTCLDTSGMQTGDCAGIAAFQSRWGIAAVTVDDDGKRIVMKTGEGQDEVIVESVPLLADTVHLKVEFDFTDSRDIAIFYYSYDSVKWIRLGSELKMIYQLRHFVGYRAALFSYATEKIGGYVDFDFMRYEPRG